MPLEHRPPEDGAPADRVDTKPDRRRPGRADGFNPALTHLLRGQTDPDAPPDPLIARPMSQTAEWLLGACTAVTLLFLGVLIRTIV